MATSYTLEFDFSPDTKVCPSKWVTITFTTDGDGLLATEYENATLRTLDELHEQTDLDDAEFRIVKTKEEAIALLEKHRYVLVKKLAEIDAVLAEAKVATEYVYESDEEDDPGPVSAQTGLAFPA